MWAEELCGFAEHVPETGEHGVAGTVRRARRPSEVERIVAVRDGDLPGVVRREGRSRLAARPDRVADFSLADAPSSVEPLGAWWDAPPGDHRSDDHAPRNRPPRRRHEPGGDRRGEPILVGAGAGGFHLKARPDAPPLPEAVGSGSEGVPELPDPSPSRTRRRASPRSTSPDARPPFGAGVRPRASRRGSVRSRRGICPGPARSCGPIKSAGQHFRSASWPAPRTAANATCRSTTPRRRRTSSPA